MRNSTLAALLILIPLVSSSRAAAQPRPAGPVVAYAVDGSTDENLLPHLAFDAQGRSALLWYRWTGGDVEGDVVIRRFGAAGTPAGPRAQVNQFAPGFQDYPQIAMNAAGTYVVTWTSYGQTDKLTSVYARLFRWRAPVTGELAVGEGTAGTVEQNPRAGIDAAGNSVVVWESYESDLDVYARLYDGSGAPRGPAFRVAGPGAFERAWPHVGMRPDGSFTVVWRTWNQGGAGAAVYARRFAADGTPRGAEVRVSQAAIRGQGMPSIALGLDGSAVIAWDRCDFSDVPAGCSLAARRLGPDGRFLGNEFLVSPRDHDAHQSPDVAFDARGSFAIAWTDCLQDAGGQPYNCRVQTSFHAPSGALLGRRVIASANNLVDASIAGLASGFVVAWDTISCDVRGCPGAGLPQGVFAQRFAVRLPGQE